VPDRVHGGHAVDGDRGADGCGDEDDGGAGAGEYTAPPRMMPAVGSVSVGSEQQQAASASLLASQPAVLQQLEKELRQLSDRVGQPLPALSAAITSVTHASVSLDVGSLPPSAYVPNRPTAQPPDRQTLKRPNLLQVVRRFLPSPFLNCGIRIEADVCFVQH